MRAVVTGALLLWSTAGCQAVLGIEGTEVVAGGADAAPSGIDADTSAQPDADTSPSIDAAVPIPDDSTLFIPYSMAAGDLGNCHMDTDFGVPQVTNRHGTALTDSCFFAQNPGEEKHDGFPNAGLAADATIAAWIQPSGTASNAFAVGEEGYPALSRSQTNERMAMIVEHNSTLFEATDDAALPSVEWTFYVGVMEFLGASGTEIRLYRNGDLISTTQVSGFIHTNEGCGVSVGGHNENAGTCRSLGFQGFQGTFDDIRIFDRVLSDGEIRALFNEPAP